ncbi:MAG: hypothetical protein J2P37_36435 [Ktedonobacteraceae bacterium]|nr:hypothetical protein [Ktedonobacteraceae bacterium]
MATVLSRRTNAPITPLTQIKDVVWPDRAVRIVNSLDAAGIKTVGELCRLSESDLRKVRQIGQGCIDTIKEVLDSAGLSLVKHCSKCGAPIDETGRFAHRR